jgi:hypothetical protein
MFVFKKSKADAAASREAEVYASAAATAAAMFLYFAAIRAACVQLTGGVAHPATEAVLGNAARVAHGQRL